MAMSMPHFCKEEYGVRRYSLTSEEFMQPCKLFDVMSRDPEVCAAGAFIGELNNLPEYTPDAIRREVQAIKAELKRQTTFYPVVQQRQCLWSELGSLAITPQYFKYAENRQVRKDFLEEIMPLDFSCRKRTTFLLTKEEALQSGGVSKLLDTFFDGCSLEGRKIMYAPGLSMPKGKEIGMAPGLKMCHMDSPNIAKLEFTDPKGKTTNSIPGINIPTVYVGTEYSSFNLHAEDFFFQSINRMVEGSDKFWFVIPPAYHNDFTVWMSQCGVCKDGSADTNCASYLQHKHFFVDPRVVVQAGFPVRTIRQRPGDVVYLLPAAIHWGINVGFNINEAVNCASSSWLKSGMMAKPPCSCRETLKEMLGVQLGSVLMEAGLSQNEFQNWECGRIVNIFDQDDIMNPYCLKRGKCPFSMANLLGEELSATDDSQEDCKELRKCYYQFQGPILDGFIGTIIVDVDDTDDDGDDDDDEQSDGKDCVEDGATRKDGCKLVYKCLLPCTCPCQCTCKCPFQALKQGKSGLSNLTNHMKSWHKKLPSQDLQDKIDEATELYDKRNRNFSSPFESTCDKCGKVIQETSNENENLKRHKSSSLCTKVKPSKSRRKI
ncbi:Lysine-specific demethylase 4 [Frankliniella fusca]|uniref:Lysine-specific demethylase 4 n=1 Tax=Frankliniella fusca TaxID=407009 RepID=A0AAE1HRN6_9NEOP|nr:Lysine-specific demethylase 4 [Frankliniella fusca]